MHPIVACVITDRFTVARQFFPKSVEQSPSPNPSVLRRTIRLSLRKVDLVASQAERILSILTKPHLRRSGVEANDLARELGVTVRQLRRDRALLERFGFPLQSAIGDDGVHRLRFVPLASCHTALPSPRERSSQ